MLDDIEIRKRYVAIQVLEIEVMCQKKTLVQELLAERNLLKQCIYDNRVTSRNQAGFDIFNIHAVLINTLSPLVMVVTTKIQIKI